MTSVVARVWLVWTVTFLVQILCMCAIVGASFGWEPWLLSGQFTVAALGTGYVSYLIIKDIRSWDA